MNEMILDRINNYVGYGNPNSNIWFIGLEEGFNGNIDQLELRIERMYNRVFADVVTDMAGVGDHEVYYGENATRIQGTMNRIIQILQSLNDTPEEHRNLSILDYQKEYLGRPNSNHAILELSSLPNPSINTWLEYYINTNIQNLGNRTSYNRNILPERIQYLRNLISQEYNPRIVVCYSYMKKYLARWEELIGTNVYEDFGFYRYYQNNGKHYFVTPHTNPQAGYIHGYGPVGNNEWEQIRGHIVQTYNQAL